MEESPIHSRAVQHAHGASVRVGKDRFGPILSGDRLEPGCNRVDGFGPGNASKRATAFRAGSCEWIEESIGIVFAIEILGDLAAKKSLSDGMVGIALQSSCAA